VEDESKRKQEVEGKEVASRQKTAWGDSHGGQR
jgi:hypothetical protein